MLAAENGGLPGGKIGGMGDVLRDLPRALANLGHRVTVLTPSYGFLARLPGAEDSGSFAVPFAGRTETCRRLSVPSGCDGLEYELLDHPRFAPGGQEQIYHDDGPDAPFATDAGKFAFFCAAAAERLRGLVVAPDVVHLHDWHTGLLLLLRGYDTRYRALRKIRTVFTIHNLALQGIRPERETDSSLLSWYPGLRVPDTVIADPRYPNCVNPVAAAIRLADAVNTVSPSYAREILLPSDERTGRHGGEALEGLLVKREREGALHGILNGCEYPDAAKSKPGWKALVAILQEALAGWVAAGRYVDSAAWLADKRLAELPKKKPRIIATSIGRITEQKVGLFEQKVGRTATAMDRVLDALDGGLLIMLGSGELEHERFLQQAMVRYDNFVFLRGYSDRLSEALYSAGDLFLMPSVFEPCGISQMLAMRAGQPVVAHSVGGLADTVTPRNGFPFTGATRREQAQNFARELAAAVDMKLGRPEQWKRIVAAARRARFTWDASAARYLTELYGFDAPAHE